MTSLSIDTTVIELLSPIKQLINDHPGVTELTMYEPGVFHLHIGAEKKRVAVPAMDHKYCMSLAKSISYRVQQVIGPEMPLMSATLPDGERIQIVVPPAVESDKVSFTIRIPSSSIKSLDEYEADGIFKKFIWIESQDIAKHWDAVSRDEQILVELLRSRNLKDFFVQAVRGKKTIAVVGDTGSGKTTLMKSICTYIPPTERLLTIEDTRELFLPHHEDKAHLLYSKGGQGVAKVTPADLIGATMRMKPDRILLAELRAGEAFDFLKLLTTGHPGSITSYHAESCDLAVERYCFMAKEHVDAAIYPVEELKRLVALTIDVVVHITAKKFFADDGKPLGVERFITEVSFNPARRFADRIGQGGVLHHA